jgi:hypothetical protein
MWFYAAAKICRKTVAAIRNKKMYTKMHFDTSLVAEPQRCFRTAKHVQMQLRHSRSKKRKDNPTLIQTPFYQTRKLKNVYDHKTAE